MGRPTTWILCGLLAFAACDSRSPGDRKDSNVRAPRLLNREAILEEREAISERLLAQGDSLLIKVFIYVDEGGMPRQPEIKQEIADRRIHDAAIALVRNMRFQPAMEDGKAVPVMLTIPVKLVRR